MTLAAPRDCWHLLAVLQGFLASYGDTRGRRVEVASNKDPVDQRRATNGVPSGPTESNILRFHHVSPKAIEITLQCVGQFCARIGVAHHVLIFKPMSINFRIAAGYGTGLFLMLAKTIKNNRTKQTLAFWCCFYPTALTISMRAGFTVLIGAPSQVGTFPSSRQVIVGVAWKGGGHSSGTSRGGAGGTWPCGPSYRTITRRFFCSDRLGPLHDLGTVGELNSPLFCSYFFNPPWRLQSFTIGVCLKIMYNIVYFYIYIYSPSNGFHFIGNNDASPMDLEVLIHFRPWQTQRLRPRLLEVVGKAYSVTFREAGWHPWFHLCAVVVFCYRLPWSPSEVKQVKKKDEYSRILAGFSRHELGGGMDLGHPKYFKKPPCPCQCVGAFKQLLKPLSLQAIYPFHRAEWVCPAGLSIDEFGHLVWDISMPPTMLPMNMSPTKTGLSHVVANAHTYITICVVLCPSS